MAMKYGKPLLDSSVAFMTGVPSQTAKTAALSMGPGGVGGVANAATSGLAKTAMAGMGSGLGSMGAAAMASPLAPIIGGIAAMKLLGFFSGGGQVGGPLSSAQYKSAGGDIYKLSYGGGPLKKGV